MSLSNHPNVLVPSSKKDRYGDIDAPEPALPGGLVKLDERVLHCTVTSLSSVDIGKKICLFLFFFNGYIDCFFSGEHVPIRSDSMLVHPATMETVGIAIATAVLVECGRTSVTVCRVWPCVTLPLDGV